MQVAAPGHIPAQARGNDIEDCDISALPCIHRVFQPYAQPYSYRPNILPCIRDVYARARDRFRLSMGRLKQ